MMVIGMGKSPVRYTGSSATELHGIMGNSLFFLFGFSFTSIHESGESGGKGEGAFL